MNIVRTPVLYRACAVDQTLLTGESRGDESWNHTMYVYSDFSVVAAAWLRVRRSVAGVNENETNITDFTSKQTQPNLT
jgi:hypothetical protein